MDLKPCFVASAGVKDTMKECEVMNDTVKGVDNG